MATFKRCDEPVTDMARELIEELPCYQLLKDRRVRIDFLFAFPEFDEVTGEPKGDALKKNGCKALGIARKLSSKDRAAGRGDAEICLDGHWWETADEAEQRALLDHELYHLVVCDENDDLGRPKLKLRPHDYEFGWFKEVAARHGMASQERKQATLMMERGGQYFWPELLQQTGGRVQRLEFETDRDGDKLPPKITNAMRRIAKAQEGRAE